MHKILLMLLHQRESLQRKLEFQGYLLTHSYTDMQAQTHAHTRTHTYAQTHTRMVTHAYDTERSGGSRHLS